MLGRGLPSQGSLVDVERAVIMIFGDGRKLADLDVGHPGSFANEEANFVELKSKIFYEFSFSNHVYLNSHIPHASKRENMKTSFMVSSCYLTFFFLTFSAFFGSLLSLLIGW